jgi:N-acetylmuramoyl-L-alanine amidase
VQTRIAGIIDIAYNWLIGGDGNIYTGRGWDVDGQHIDSPGYSGWNRNSTGIAFIGDFNSLQPTPAAITAYKHLIALGIKHGHVASDYTLYSHYDIECTYCPGLHLRYMLKSLHNYRVKAPHTCVPSFRRWLHPM